MKTETIVEVPALRSCAERFFPNLIIGTSSIAVAISLHLNSRHFSQKNCAIPFARYADCVKSNYLYAEKRFQSWPPSSRSVAFSNRELKNFRGFSRDLASDFVLYNSERERASSATTSTRTNQLSRASTNLNLTRKTHNE